MKILTVDVITRQLYFVRQMFSRDALFMPVLCTRWTAHNGERIRGRGGRSGRRDNFHGIGCGERFPRSANGWWRGKGSPTAIQREREESDAGDAGRFLPTDEFLKRPSFLPHPRIKKYTISIHSTAQDVQYPNGNLYVS